MDEHREVSRGPTWFGRAGLAFCVVAGILVALTQSPPASSSLERTRIAADSALQALEDRDLFAVGEVLAAHRGEVDFAYLFTAKTTARSLGDVLSGVAGEGDDSPFADGLDADTYELALTDLAGTVALATFGTGVRALPPSWTQDFIAATTTPGTVESDDADSVDESGEPGEFRANQDLANRQNLLLLLSRGYWSSEFLKDVTDAYWEFDRENGDDAWPGDRIEDARYAPSPNGTYLTDGVLALTAALTANPAASKWAFTEFQPETVEVGGSDYELGSFTYYLLYEHQFPEDPDGLSVGMTAVLTALSAAIDAAHGAAGGEAVESAEASSEDVGPVHDTVVLQALAEEAGHAEREESDCSWNPIDYWDCVKKAAGAVLGWVQNWGHLVLDILSLATFAPPPFPVVGITAAATNATWYAIDGDYAMAGLSLAAAVPGLAFTKIVKAVKAGTVAEKAAVVADDVAAAVNEVRLGARMVATRELAEAGATRTATSPRLFNLETEARDMVAADIPKSSIEVPFNPPGCAAECVGKRLVDVWDSESATAIEVKIGTRNEAYAISEVLKDSALLQDMASGVNAVEWRFYPDLFGRVGPSEKVRELLLANRIPYVMYLP